MISKKLITSITIGTVLSLIVAGSSFAAGNPSTTGQPNANCEEETTAPNGFSTSGFANAQTNYAGSGESANHANSSNAVSQYDVACYQLSTH